MPLVNEGDWSYTNFTSDTGAFEDELGNSVLFEFQNDFEEDIDIIQSLNVSIVPVRLSKTSFLELTLLKVAKRYELYKAKSSDVN